MEFGLVTVSLLVVAALLVLAGLKLLFKTNWFLQFLRGFFGFGFLLLAFLLILSGLNIATYSQLADGQEIANISFARVANQSYEATIVNVKTGEQQKITLEGDQWQVDARILALAFTSTPFYKLEGISGRYYSLDQELTNNRKFHPITGQSMGIDLWSLFEGRDIGILSATYAKSTTYLPMGDDTLFSISVDRTGLVLAPVNASAKAIVNEWQ